MRRVTVAEYERIRRADLPAELLQRLQRFDEACASGGQPVFDWSRVDHVVAQNMVGVIEIPGLQVEILPKIDRDGDQDDGGQVLRRAQRNLVWMLSVAGALPFEDRALASQEHQRAPLLETLVRRFADNLLMELGRGIHHAYCYREDVLPVVRGKVLIERQLRLHHGKLNRVHVGFDEFTGDTLINQILKAACRFLLARVRDAENQTRLRRALIELADVEDVDVRPDHFQQLHLERTAARIEPLLRFARLVLRQQVPGLSTGQTRTFSLLFPMEQVFEAFIGQLLLRHADRFGWRRSQVHLQARARGLWLLRDGDEKGCFRLRPDVVVDADTGPDPQMILDTKWKRLMTDAEDRRNGVSQADLYQLFAYARRYDCPRCVLLYPRRAGTSPKTYRLDGPGSYKCLRVGLVDLNRDLPGQKEALLEDIRQAVATPTASSSVAWSPGTVHAGKVPEGQTYPNTMVPGSVAWKVNGP